MRNNRSHRALPARWSTSWIRIIGPGDRCGRGIEDGAEFSQPMREHRGTERFDAGFRAGIAAMRQTSQAGDAITRQVDPCRCGAARRLPGGRRRSPGVPGLAPDLPQPAAAGCAG
jgi:hypothetical protein